VTVCHQTSERCLRSIGRLAGMAAAVNKHVKPNDAPDRP
jgi:hypothetical protein